MFAIINVSQTNAVFRKPEISSQRVALQNAETFFLVTTEKSYGRVPWKKLENCMGILKKDVILTGDTVLPEYSGISEFIPDVFPYIVLINTAIDRLKNGRHKSLIIFDEKAICMDYIQSFVNSFERIRVITPYAEKYTAVARILLENYGFSLEVSADPSYDSDVIISNNCDVPLYFSGKVFSNKRKFMMNAEMFSGGEIVLPEEYESIRPEGVDKLLFASALYEKCNISELGNLKFI